MSDLSKALAALVTLAIIAVIVSNRSTTATVVSSAFSTFNNLMSVIVSPITERKQSNVVNGGGGLFGALTGAGGLGSILDPSQLVGSLNTSDLMSIVSGA